VSELANLTAVVLNWRTPDHTVRAVRALVADGVPRERVVVVDNGSGDGSAERFRAELPATRLLALDENVGFARGNNLGAAALAGSGYLFVNSDAFVQAPGTVSRLCTAAAHPAIGIAVPRLLNEDGTLQPNVVPTSSPLPELVRASGLSRFVPNRLQPSLGTHWDHARSRLVQAAIGAVLLVRGEAWHALGGFDETRFMYAEDIDLCWRATKLGWHTAFVADAVFVHLGNASGGARWSDPERAERAARAQAEMIREHLPPRRAALTLALMAAGVGGRALVRRVSGDAAAADTMRGWWRGYSAGVRGR
jgi:N-acetylglucosaminyl-diphospho-decaprenol L-rhamnosyltransferase